jgi:8-oxo-dGTP diphosphatase
MSNKRVSAIIIDKGKILLIHRLKGDDEYYVLPGGSVEEKETNSEALIREIKEETGLDIVIDKELYKVNNNYDARTQHILLAKSVNGRLTLGEPELSRQSKDNKYILEWHDIAELKNLKIFPEEIKEKIIKEF